VKRALFEYELPRDCIATHPLEARDGARLMVLDAHSEGQPTQVAATIEHAHVRDLVRLVAPGTVLVVNDTRVIPARLLGRKRESRGRVEILLARQLDAKIAFSKTARWLALARSSKPIRVGTQIVFDAEDPLHLEGEVVSRGDDGRMLEIVLTSRCDDEVDTIVHKVGQVPLPPYLHRPPVNADRERYQTVFARAPGAVAAPTAGLHLSLPLLDTLRTRGVTVSAVTLHVGPGTFEPVTADDLDDHPMHAEAYDVPVETANAILAARGRGARVLAVGTTVVRALESAADVERSGLVRACSGETKLLVQPGYVFRVVDDLLTNFHLPGSTLVALVAAFAGRERILAAYRAGAREGYRFLSYGDAMLIRGLRAPVSLEAS
jgi:S-adenosylmethionine:tRNA ribosyltransferase-isomerase